jgi:hypothetical protein
MTLCIVVIAVATMRRPWCWAFSTPFDAIIGFFDRSTK